MSRWRFERPAAMPLPQPDAQAQPFFDALNEGRLAVQRCKHCETLAHPPRALCPGCQRKDFDWPAMSGKGTVYSYVVTHQAIHPAFAGRTPLATVEVALAEGPRLTSNLLDVPPEKIAIGMPVVACLERVAEGVVLPLFRAARAEAA